MTPSDNVCALRFAYRHDWLGKLTVEMNGNVLKTFNATGDKWMVEVLPLIVDQPVSIQFVMRSSIVDISSRVEAALDDIQFIPCTCELVWCVLFVMFVVCMILCCIYLVELIDIFVLVGSIYLAIVSV